MTKDEEFLARWNADRNIYAAWGRHVSEMLKKALAAAIAPIDVSYFLKATVSPRLKGDQELVSKAFYRGKEYADPYTAITDKVGTRFVVLLGSDVGTVVRTLETIPGLTRSKDRDYEEEQNKNPLTFDYAAVHFVVRPTEDIDVDEIIVPAGTPCEVQIKTILQHAYSELTHDTIYKPQIDATSTMRRSAAKAMALLEATNDYFEKVAKDVNDALGSVRSITARLSELYRRAVGVDPKPSLLEGLLLEAYEASAPADYADRLDALLREKPFLIERIRERVAHHSPLFQQPSVLLAYLAIKASLRTAKKDWPLTPEEIEPLLNDFGETRH